MSIRKFYPVRNHDGFLYILGTYSFSDLRMSGLGYDCCFLKRIPGPKVIKIFSCSTQLRLKFILLINVKMNANNFWHLRHFNINKQDK